MHRRHLAALRAAPRRLAALLVLAATLPAGAGSTSDTFQVTATVSSACTVSGTVLDFGSGINPLTASVPVDASSTLTVRCTNTTPYAVALDAGLYAASATTFSDRKMASGANRLAYQLYLDASRSTVWGDGSSSTQTHGGTGTGSNQSVTIYGRVAALTGVVPGSYADTVTVTVSY